MSYAAAVFYGKPQPQIDSVNVAASGASDDVEIVGESFEPPLGGPPVAVKKEITVPEFVLKANGEIVVPRVSSPFQAEFDLHRLKARAKLDSMLAKYDEQTRQENRAQFAQNEQTFKSAHEKLDQEFVAERASGALAKMTPTDRVEKYTACFELKEPYADEDGNLQTFVHAQNDDALKAIIKNVTNEDLVVHYHKTIEWAQMFNELQWTPHELVVLNRNNILRMESRARPGMQKLP